MTIRQTLFFCLCLACSVVAAAQSRPKREVRAAWITAAYGLDWPRTKATDAQSRQRQQAELTDMLDNLILDTAGGFIMNCPDQILCGRVLPLLAPIQMGRRRAKEIPVVSRAAFEAYAPQKDKPGAQ